MNNKEEFEKLSYVGKWKVGFGKYRGTLYKDLNDYDYIEWVVDNEIIQNSKIVKYLALKVKLELGH